MNAKKNVITIFSFLFLIIFTPLLKAEDKNMTLEIIPSQVFAGDDVSILFQVKVDGTNPSKVLNLVEWNADNTEIKYHWELSDDGARGDQKAGDGIYSRIIQFKEQKVKTINFWVTDQNLAENTNPSSVFLHKTSPQIQNPELISDKQKASLQIIARPTFQDILKNAYQKFTHYWK